MTPVVVLYLVTSRKVGEQTSSTDIWVVTTPPTVSHTEWFHGVSQWLPDKAREVPSCVEKVTHLPVHCAKTAQK